MDECEFIMPLMGIRDVYINSYGTKFEWSGGVGVEFASFQIPSCRVPG